MHRTTHAHLKVVESHYFELLATEAERILSQVFYVCRHTQKREMEQSLPPTITAPKDLLQRGFSGIHPIQRRNHPHSYSKTGVGLSVLGKLMDI